MGDGNFVSKIDDLKQQLNHLQQTTGDPVKLKETIPEVFEQLQNILTELQLTEAGLRQQQKKLDSNKKNNKTKIAPLEMQAKLMPQLLDTSLELKTPNQALKQPVFEHGDATEGLKTRVHQQAIVAKLGQRALAGVDLYVLMDEAMVLVTEMLKTEYCQILELQPNDDTLLLRAGIGWQEGLVGQAIVSADITSQIGYTLLSNEPVIVEDIHTETRFNGLSLLHDHGVVSSLNVIIDGQNWPFGILGTHTTTQRIFTKDDINFLQAIANVLAQAIERKQAEKALRESEERYRRLVDLSFEAIVVHDEREFIYVNEAGASLYGATNPDKIVGKSIFDFVHQDYLILIKDQLKQTNENGNVISLAEKKLSRLDGTSVDVEMVAIPITYQGQSAIQIVARDITERKYTQKILAESEEKYRTLIQQSHDAIYLISGGKFEVINRKFEELFGVTQDDISDPSFVFANIVAPKNRKLVTVQTSNEKTKVSPQYEFTAQDKDGNEIEIELTVSYYPYKKGLATQGVLRDITQRKKARIEREALLEAEREQRLLAETLGEVFLALTSQTSRSAVLGEILRQVQRVVSFNAANIMLVEDNTLNLAHYQGHDSLDEPELSSALTQPLINFPLDAEVVESRQSVIVADTEQNPLWVTTPEAAWVKSFVALPICLHDQVLGLLRLDSDTPGQFSKKDLDALLPLVNGAAIALENARLYDQARQELAERVQAEDKLRRAVAKDRAILAAIPDSMLQLNRGGILLDYKVSDNKKLPSGIPSQMTVGKKIADILPSDLADQILHYVHKTLDLDTMHIFEYQLSLAQGLQEFEVRLVTSGQNEVLAIIRNVTQRKQAEASLQKSEASLRAIFDNSLQAFVLIDRGCQVQAFNKTASQNIQQVLGKKVTEGDLFYRYIPVAELGEFYKNFEMVLAGKSVKIERQQSTTNNTDEWFEFNYNPVFMDDDQVIGVCFSTVNIDERKRAADALAASEARLWVEMRALLAVTRALVSEININKLLDFIMNQAQHLMGVDETAVLLLSDDGQQFEVAACTKPAPGIEKGLRFPIQGSLAESALVKREVQVSYHIQTLKFIEPVLAALEPANVYSLLCAPLIFQHKHLGILLAWNTRERMFAQSDNFLVEVFADQAAMALYSADLHAQNRLLAIEKERHRLARNLHDSVTQSLYSIGLAAQASTRLLGEDTNSKLKEPLELIHTLSKTALTEIREQLYHLHPTALNQKGLVEALTQHCAKLGRQYALSINFEAVSGLSLSDIKQDALYFIAREALWNIVKYAKAEHVDVILTRKDDDIMLIVEDDGIGFDPSVAIDGENMGLRNIKERVKLTEGTFKLKSKPGQGTRLTVQIPLKLHVEL